MQTNNSKALTFYDRRADFLEVRMNETMFPRLRDIQPEAAFPQVKAMVVGAAILRGAGMNDEVIDLTAEALFQEIRQDFPSLTIPEVGKAIRNGCFEKYGQVYGINAVSLYKMVAGYVASEEAELLRSKEEAKRKASDAKLLKKREEWIREHPDAVMGTFVEDFADMHSIK